MRFIGWKLKQGRSRQEINGNVLTMGGLTVRTGGQDRRWRLHPWHGMFGHICSSTRASPWKEPCAMQDVGPPRTGAPRLLALEEQALLPQSSFTPRGFLFRNLQRLLAELEAFFLEGLEKWLPAVSPASGDPGQCQFINSAD